MARRKNVTQAPVCHFCWRRVSQCLMLIESAKKADLLFKTDLQIDFEPGELHHFEISNHQYSVDCNIESCGDESILIIKDEESLSIEYDEIIPTGYNVNEVKDNKTKEKLQGSQEENRPDPLYEPYVKLLNHINKSIAKEDIVIKEENDFDDTNLEDDEIFEDSEQTKYDITNKKRKLTKSISKRTDKQNNTKKVKHNSKLNKKTQCEEECNALVETDTKERRKYMSESEKAKSLGLVFVEYTLQEQLQEIEKKKQRRRYKYAKFKCHKCGLGYQTKTVYDQHYNYKHSEVAGCHECRVCGYRFHTEALLRQHASDAHARKWRCSRCGQDISRQDWVQHQNKCVPDGAKHQCDVCGKSFKSRKGMCRHKMQVHGPKQSKKFECDACNKGYDSKIQLVNHMRIHTGEKPYECAPCGKKFMTMGYLRIHLDGVHRAQEPPEERYCVECDRHFKSKRLLHAHLESTKLHVKVDQFKHECTICHKKFIHQIRLTEHMKSIHIKSKEFTCNECGKTFSTKGPLAKHLVTKHSQTERVRNNICPICGAAFLAKATVKQHILAIHEKQRPHVCNICGATFGFSGAMYTHTQLKHKGVKRNRSGGASTSKFEAY